MVQQGTRLEVADSTGVEEFLYIRVLSGSARRRANIDDIIVISVEGVAPDGVVEKNDIVEIVVVHIVKGARREDGSYIGSDEDATVITKDDKAPGEARIFGPIARELRNKQFVKIVSLAPEVL